MQQAALDQFFGVMIGIGTLGFFTVGRVPTLFLLWWRPTPLEYQTQRKRYVMTGIGVLSSGLPLGYLLWHYSPSQVHLGISAIGGFWGFMSWLVVWLHAFTVLMSLVFALHSYRKPTRYAKRSHGVFLTTDEVRFMRRLERGGRFDYVTEQA